MVETFSPPRGNCYFSWKNGIGLFMSQVIRLIANLSVEEDCGFEVVVSPEMVSLYGILGMF